MEDRRSKYYGYYTKAFGMGIGNIRHVIYNGVPESTLSGRRDIAICASTATIRASNYTDSSVFLLKFDQKYTEEFQKY